jgi:molybdate transport system ATP-binding protein
VIEILGLEPLLERRPAHLSGGEKQRVAIGRALLADPRLLLMDEPLAALDDARKNEIFPYLERLRDTSQVPIVYVSHSVAEVARLATTVVVLSEGRVVSSGSAAEIMQRLDLFPLTGRAEGGAIVDAVVEGHDGADGLTLLRSNAGLWRLQRLEADPGDRIRMRIRARDVMLAKSAPRDVSALNIFGGTVKEVSSSTDAIGQVLVDCSGDRLVARLTRHSIERLSLVPGADVYVVIKSVALGRRSLGGPRRQTPAADAEAFES